jgi:hypothetical protein
VDADALAFSSREAKCRLTSGCTRRRPQVSSYQLSDSGSGRRG